MNRRGFTLIELLATLVVLALVVSIGAYSIIQILNASKQKNYDILIDNIKSAGETYYNECKYWKNSDVCGDEFNGEISLTKLVEYGYIKSNGNDKSNSFKLVDPRNNNDISDCQIKVSDDNGKISITNLSTNNDKCPTY